MHSHPPIFEVRRVGAAAVVGLRLRVLLPDGPPAAGQFPGDELDDTFHVAALLDGDVVAVASLYWEGPPPGAIDTVSAVELRSNDDGTVWRLRGMASEPRVRGAGAGTAVLDAAMQHAAVEGGELAWCNARTPAVGFYRRMGWVVRSAEFDIPGAGPHVLMTRPLVSRLTPGTTVDAESA